MKLISWNVNGIRSVCKKGFGDFVKKYDPDILCIQETRSAGESCEIGASGFIQYWNHARKPGYAGVAVLIKIEPLEVNNGMGIFKHDLE